MNMKLQRLGLAVAIAATIAMPARAQPAALHFEIPQQDLASALEAFGARSGKEILFDRAHTRNKAAPAVNCDCTPSEALRRLLAGSGLTYRMANVDTYLVDLAQPTGVSASQDGVSTFDEIVVTAQKREEPLQEVPIPVSVIDTGRLTESGRLLIRDYYSSVPSFNMAAYYGSTQNLAIRGITTGGFSNPTVGITIDDVPYGSAINNGGSNQIPDLDPGDLARIEVLRGPQGALYGASSMGGLIKYVTVDPSTYGLEGRLEAGLSSISNGGDLGRTLRGSVNLPLGETFAMRVSGYTRTDPGYIDNPAAGIDDLNEARFDGARVSALWQPSEAVSLKLSALYQHAEADGISDVHVPTPAFPQTAGLGDLEQNNMPGSGGGERTVKAYSAILGVDFGFAELTSVTGYNLQTYDTRFDRSVVLGALAERDFGVTGMVGNDVGEIERWSQEVRLASRDRERLDWMLGVFHTDEDSINHQNFFAAERATGRIVGLDWTRNTPRTVRESALFGNVTWHVTERFDLQLGGRQSRFSEDDGEYVQTGPNVSPDPLVAPPRSAQSETFTYLVTPRFRITPEVMVYGRMASGFRAGGPNFEAPGAPDQYEPDTTRNYEVGLKRDFLDGRLSIDASLFHIDWRDIQISLRTPPPIPFVYQTNGGRAKSQGVELSVTAKPLQGLTVAGWVAYNNAVLTEAFPVVGAGSAFGRKGDRLPNSPRFSGHLSVDREFPLLDRATGFVGGAVSYMGERVSVFTSTPVRQTFPSYTRVDLRAGVRWDAWTANVYVNNVTDERGVIAGGIGYQPDFAYVYIQPRTLGVSVAWQF